jgi:hypothetical protein
MLDAEEQHAENATKVLGDAGNCVRGDLFRGGTGFIIAVHHYYFFCSLKSEPRLPSTSFGETQKGYSR